MQLIKRFSEFEIPPRFLIPLSQLLDMCFPDTFDGRTYFKQRPHHRLIALHGETLIAQVGIDFRVVNVAGVTLNVCGLIDLCVHPDHRNAGLAGSLLEVAQEMARNVDFLVLMADRHDLYLRQGYERLLAAPTKWLAIEDRSSIAVIERDMSDCFMVKPLADRKWPPGQIDMLGYLF